MRDEEIRDHLHQQYASQDCMQIRIRTHQKYTIPRVDFTSWILDQIDWQGTETVIDAGCGNGNYAAAVQQRCRHYVAGDLSYGMLSGLAASRLNRVNLNVHHLPFSDASADVVLANHMLYYVDLARAPTEIYRVLRSGGCLLAATNSEHTMVELAALQEQVLQRLDRTDASLSKPEVLQFTLENGALFLNSHFDQVIRVDLPSALVFTEPQPLIDYVGTIQERFAALIDTGITWSQISTAIEELLAEQIQTHGAFRVSKLTGVFICRKK